MSEETEIKQTGDAEEPVVVEVEETGSEAPEEKVVEQEPEVIVEQEATEEPSDELETYSKNVQNRIKKQTAKYHQEKRDKEEAQRVAQQLLQENNNLKAHNKQLDSGYLNQYGAKVDAQLQTARQAYKEAYESGDSDAVVKAQEYLSRATIDSDRYNVAKQRADQRLSVEQAQPEQQRQAVAPQQAAPPPPPRQEDPKARGWAEKNTWFGQDEVMTYAAFGIHRKMVEEEGFDPLSNEYYTEVDRRLLSEFPAKLGVKKTGGSTQVAPAGSSASRSTKKGRRTVTLTPSQVAMAKKLNVPISEYAKYVKD